jgi:hypothetical protein
MATRGNVIALAASVWPEASNITVEDFAAGNVPWTGPDPPTSGLVLLAIDAQGAIMHRLKADTLDDLQAEVEKMRQSKGNAKA